MALAIFYTARHSFSSLITALISVTIHLPELGEVTLQNTDSISEKKKKRKNKEEKGWIET